MKISMKQAQKKLDRDEMQMLKNQLDRSIVGVVMALDKIIELYRFDRSNVELAKAYDALKLVKDQMVKVINSAVFK